MNQKYYYKDSFWLDISFWFYSNIVVLIEKEIQTVEYVW